MATDEHSGTNPEATTTERAADERPDIEQAVESRSDAVDRGEGGPEAETMTAPGLFTGSSGTGGVVRNQDSTEDAQ